MDTNLQTTTMLYAVIPPRMVADSQAVVGHIIDTKGARAVDYIIITGIVSDGDASFQVTMEDAALQDFSDAALVPAPYVIGQESAEFSFEGSNQIRRIGHRCRKRWSRITVTPADNSQSAGLSVMAGVYGLTYSAPVDQVTAPAPDPELPDAVSDFVATAASDTVITMTWTPEASNTYLQGIRRSPAGANSWTVLETELPADADEYSNESLPPETGYDYQQFFTVGGIRVYSNMDGATTEAEEVVDPDALSLDAPLNTGTQAKARYAFGFERMVEGYVGDTVRLVRVSDNAEANFGFSNSTGIFDLDAVDAWRGSADVNVVRFLDQMVSSKTLDVVQGTVTFIVSGAVKRFGTSWDESTAQLTRSGVEGGVGCDFGDNVSAMRLSGSVLPVSVSGAEFHLLYSHNERKNSSGTALDGNTDRENLLYYGLNSNTQMYVYNGGGVGTQQMRIQTASTGQTTTVTASSITLKAMAQQVQSIKLDKTNGRTALYANGKRNVDATFTSGTITAVAGGTMDNGDIVIGAAFSSSSTNALATTNRPNIVFGGLLVTDALTDSERFFVQAKLNAIGQQHRIATQTEIFDLFDDMVRFSDMDAGTGELIGLRGALEIDVNLGTVTDGISTFTSTFVANYTAPDTGVTGLFSPFDGSKPYGNCFEARDTFFAGKTSGTVFTFGMMRADPATPADNGTLSAFVSQSNDTPYAVTYAGDGVTVSEGDRGKVSLTMGRDHQAPTVVTRIPTERSNNEDWIGTRKLGGIHDGVLFPLESVKVGGNDSQPLHKYDRNTPHTNLPYDLVITKGSGIAPTALTYTNLTLTEAFMAATVEGGVEQPFIFDAPIIRPLPENTYVLPGYDHLLFHIASFEAPPEYHRADPWSTRKAYRLKGTTKSYISSGVDPLGHKDGTIALNTHSAVVDSPDNARIKTNPYQMPYKGTRVMMGFSSQVLTQAEMEMVQVNLYKFLGEIDLPPTIPANQILPTFSGTLMENEEITIDKGTWSGFPIPTYTYQINRSGTPVGSPTTDNTYDLVTADVGTNTITVTVTATNTAGSASITSDPVTIAPRIAPVNTVAPVASGLAKVDQVVSCDGNGTWTGTTPIEYTHQWYKTDGTTTFACTGTGNQNASYTLTSAELGLSVFRRTTGTNPKGSSSVNSNSLGPVTEALPYILLSTVEPTVVFEIDATLEDCYSGSGTTLLNLEPTPADGAAQSDYDFIATGLTFTGTAGDDAAYFDSAGSGYLTVDAADVASMPDFMKHIHLHPGDANAQDFWFVVFGQFVTTASGEQTFFSTQGASSSALGLRAYINTANLPRIQQRGDSTGALYSLTTPTIPLGIPTFFAVSHNKTSGQSRVYAGSLTAQTAIQAFVTASGDPTELFRIFARAAATSRMLSGSRFYAAMMGQGVLDDTKLAAIIAHIEARHARDYTP
jgi:hypothetical protein